MLNVADSNSTRPYMIRALYEWCVDHHFTPYVAVKVDASVQVPREFVQGGEIVLNISFDATSSLQLGNEFIEFKARFGGKPRDIMVPINRVMAIYARENGQGMSFPVTDSPLGQTVVGMDKLAVCLLHRPRHPIRSIKTIKTISRFHQRPRAPHSLESNKPCQKLRGLLKSIKY